MVTLNLHRKEAHVKTIKSFVVIIALLVAQESYGIVVDGNVSDWGVTPGSDWTPSVNVFSWVEDWTGIPTNGYVSPGYGGQKYDVEGVYATFSNNNLYTAIVLGLPPNGASANGQYYYPGDLAISADGDLVFEFGIELTGYTDGYPPDGTVTYQYHVPGDVGKVYSVTSGGWNNGLNWGTATTVVELAHNASNTEVHQTTVVYIQDGSSEHYVIETSVPISLLDLEIGDEIIIQFSATCGNDVGRLSFFFPGQTIEIPEPMTIISILMGIASLFICKKQ